MSRKEVDTYVSEQYVTSACDKDTTEKISVVSTVGAGYGFGQIWWQINDPRYSPESCVALEIWKGQLRVIVWADPEQEDPTHIIQIEPMSEELRKEYERDIKDDGQAVPVE